MKRVGQKIYDSAAWQKLRLMKLSTCNYLCEKCGQPAQIVHHKTPITTDNVNDTSVTLNLDNLEALCSSCHNKEHDNFRHFHRNSNSQGRQPIFDERGDVVAVTGEKEFRAERQTILEKFSPAPCCQMTHKGA